MQHVVANDAADASSLSSPSLVYAIFVVDSLAVAISAGAAMLHSPEPSQRGSEPMALQQADSLAALARVVS